MSGGEAGGRGGGARGGRAGPGGEAGGRGGGGPGGSARGSETCREPAVAGLFYPRGSTELGGVVDELLAAADDLAANRPAPPFPLAGILVPHAGLVYSGIVAATAWRLLPAGTGSPRPTVVLLGTNHSAGWLTGIGAWVDGPWRTPLGDAAPDVDLVRAILDLGAPFVADSRCHLGEHSLEVQLPFVRRLSPDALIVPLSVGCGTGSRAIEAGERLGGLLAARQAAGEPILVAISTDMAHYPPARVAEQVTTTLLPHILGLDPAGLATAESASWEAGPGVSCGMCGIEPGVVGLATLRAMGARPGTLLAAATSADAGGDPRRTVGYLAAAFGAG